MLYKKFILYIHPSKPVWKNRERFHSICFLYSTAIIIWNNLVCISADDNIKYLTSWGANLVNFYFLVACFLSLKPWLLNQQKSTNNVQEDTDQQQQEDLPHQRSKENQTILLQEYYNEYYHRTANILFVLALSFQLPITLMFWGYLYPVEGSEDIQLDSNLHGGLLIPIFLEFLYGSQKLHKRQFTVVTTGIILYLIVNLCFTFIEGRAVYTGIDYETFFSYIIVIGMVLLVILWFFIALLVNQKLQQ